jgi:MFS family permease
MVVNRRAWTVTGLIGSIHFVQHVFRILPPLLPVLALALQYPLWQLGALVSLYFGGSGFGQAPMGVFADRYDRRLLLPPSMATMGIGYLIVGLAPRVAGPETIAFVLSDAPITVQFVIMGAGALLAGVGASAIHPCGYPLVIANTVDGREGWAFGIWASAAKLGDATAPIVIAVLVLIVSWSLVFLFFGIVGILYAVVLFGALSSDLIETRPGDQRTTTDTDTTDPNSSSDDVNDDRARRDGRRDKPTELDWRTDRRYYIYPFAALFVFFIARAFSEKGLKAFLPTFIVTVYGFTLTVGEFQIPAESFADAYFSAVFVIAAVTTLLTGWLVDRFDSRWILIVFFIVATSTLVVFATAQLSPLSLLILLVVLGASNWGLAPARDAIMSEITPPAREGRTFGYLHTVSHLFSAVAPVTIGIIAEVSDLRQSFLYLAVVMLLAAVAIASLLSSRIYVPVKDPN